MKKRADGRYQKKITLASGKQKFVYGRTLAEINRQVDEIRAQERAGLVLDDHTLVGEWAKKWLETYKSKKRAKTVSMYRNAYNKHIMEHIGAMALRDVRPVHIQEVMQAVADKSESTQNKVLITLKQIFRTAMENHLISSNPAMGASITKHNAPPKKKYLTTEETSALFDAAAKIDDHRAALLCGLCLYCGLRREEALGLQWGDIKDGVLTVNRAVTFIGNRPDPNQELKTKAAHRGIPIPAPLQAMLDSAPRRNLYVITTADGNPMTQIAFKRLWDKIAAAVPFRVTPHMLRHTYCTSLVLAGVHLKRAQYLMGHSSIQMTANIYSHIEAQDVANIAKKIDIFFAQAGDDGEGQKNRKVVKK